MEVRQVDRERATNNSRPEPFAYSLPMESTPNIGSGFHWTKMEHEIRAFAERCPVFGEDSGKTTEQWKTTRLRIPWDVYRTAEVFDWLA